MTSKICKRRVFGLFLALCGAGHAQESPVNMHMRAQWVSPVLCADVWGDGHFLFGAHYQRWGGPAQVTILDIQNPDAPVLASIYLIPPSGNPSGPEDVQASNGLLFTGNETVASGSDGAFVADVRDPYHPMDRLLRPIRLHPIQTGTIA